MYTSNMALKKPLENFIREISEINENDFGDFMRRANHYLLILIGKIYRGSTPQVRKLLLELQYTIQYQPDWNIDSTKQKIFARIDLIKQSRNAHVSDMHNI